MTDTVTIIGAGIGGLTTALTLQQRGLNVAVYEGSAAIQPVGAGIILANNAMQVFKKLGISDSIEKAGHRISAIKITDAQLRPLSVVALQEYEKKHGVHNIAIHRGELQRILANAVGFNSIHLSKRLAKIEKELLFQLTFEDNTHLETNLIIGADGINSVVRNQLFEKSSLRDAGQICWRGICNIELPKDYHHEMNEAWGKGKRFGFVKISTHQVYWFALTNSKNTDPGEVDLTDLFQEFHPDILHIITSTPPEQIIVGPIRDLKPIPTWHSENVCLIGDAAHATTPNLGQGACQAIEDAFVLGQLLDQGIPLAATFTEYEKRRRKKADKIVSASWTLGKIAHWSHPVPIWFRNLFLRITPNAANRKQMNEIFELHSEIL